MFRRFGLRWRTVLLYSAFIVCILYFLVDFYLLSIQKNDLLRDTNHHHHNNRNNNDALHGKIESFVTSDVSNGSDVLDAIVDGLMRPLLPCENCDAVSWNATRPWLDARHVHPEDVAMLGRILRKMATAKITDVKAGRGGTQLKLFLWLEGGQKVAFKPMRFSRHDVIKGTPYAGADRHNGEIAGFHLNRLLNFRRGPLVVGRKVNVKKELIPVGDPKLLKTFVERDNKTCFYGICHYCNPLDLVCADDNDELEGAVILWLPTGTKLKMHRHPWSRTYRDGVKALWETHDDFCNSVKTLDMYKSGTLLLDVIDAAIFDYLIGNADRHRYEVLDGVEKSMLLLLDNGKSFGNPYHDEHSILAPLYQCCMIRYSTWQRLLLFDHQSLASSLQKMMSYDPLAPILTAGHLDALNRRLATVKTIVTNCGATNKKAAILVNDQ